MINGLQTINASVAARNTAIPVGGGLKYTLLLWMLLSGFPFLGGERDGWKETERTSSLCNTEKVLAQLVNIIHQWMASQSWPLRVSTLGPLV